MARWTCFSRARWSSILLAENARLCRQLGRRNAEHVEIYVRTRAAQEVDVARRIYWALLDALQPGSFKIIPAIH